LIIKIRDYSRGELIGGFDIHVYVTDDKHHKSRGESELIVPKQVQFFRKTIAKEVNIERSPDA